MSREPGPVFLERRTYRRRRMADAARLLPVIGAVLFMLPLLWLDPSDGQPQTSTTAVMFFVFGAWIVLVAVAAAISRNLSDPQDPPSSGGR